MTAPKIGFVGIGRMGANMARRLQDAGYAIAAVYDVDRARTADLANEIGAEPALSLERVTAAADLVFTVVTDDKAQLDVFAEGGDSLLKGARGKIFINCATIMPGTHIEVERRARRADAVSLEACMAS